MMTGGNYLNPTVMGFPFQIADSGRFGIVSQWSIDGSGNPFSHWLFDSGTYGGTGGYVIWEFSPSAVFEVNSAGVYWNGSLITGGGGGGNTILTADDATYFADGTHNTIFTPTVTAAYKGQLYTAYDAGIGGQQAGQEFISGNDLSWRRNRQFGRITAFDVDGADCAVFAKTNGANENAITMQNISNSGYSAARFIDLSGNERGAVGYANPGAAVYGGSNYLEDYGGDFGFNFVASGLIVGGMEANTQDFVWYASGVELCRMDGSGGVFTWGGGVFAIDSVGDCSFAGNINTNVGLAVTGTQVVGPQQPNIPNATATTAINTSTINAILSLLATHGLMA